MKWVSLTSLVFIVLAAVIGGCSNNPPNQPGNLCKVFQEKPKWYRGAVNAQKAWGLPVAVGMAFVYRESSYVSDAKPPRGKLLWVIPWRRPSSAYGYAQATDEAWEDYKKQTRRLFVERDDLRDALDFIGWYNDRSHRQLGIAKNDSYNLYLAYYVGPTGYARGVWKNQPSVRNYARRVVERAESYQKQLNGCVKQLERSRRWFF
ncbi:MAG: hypothetical protein O7E57_12570 [Gammaproteobacteria bacterium]|nr:hypothetical protein [Gammaproteobacteria bacterium]